MDHINIEIQILKAKMDDDYSRAQTVSSSINQVRNDTMVFMHKACAIVTLDVYFFCLMGGGAPNK